MFTAVRIGSAMQHQYPLAAATASKERWSCGDTLGQRPCEFSNSFAAVGLGRTVLRSRDWSAHARLRHLWPDLAVRMPRWRQYAEVSDRAAADLVAVLAAGDRRCLRRH